MRAKQGRAQPARDGSSSAEQPGKFRRVDLISGEDRRGIGDAQVPDNELAEDITEICRDRQVAAFVSLGDRETWPSTVDPPAVDGTADSDHRVAMPVIRPAVAVLVDGT